MSSTRAATALAHLGETDPGLALLALWIAHVDDAGPTRSGEGRIVYGPDFDTRPLPEQVGLVAHHVLHVALRHAARQAAFAGRTGGGSGEIFNLAADALVNVVVLEGGHALPRPAVTLAALADGSFADETGDGLARWDAERLAHALMASEAGARRTIEEGARRGFAPDLEPGAAAASDAGGADREAEWQGRLARAAELGQAAGRGTGAILARLGDARPSPVPWQHRLRRLATPALSAERRLAWRRPANRWIAGTAHAAAEGRPAPIFEPGPARDLRRPRIAVALDTSSSIADADLARFAAEVTAIAGRTGAETHLLAFDDAVHTCLRVEPGGLGARIADLELRRGGGTSFAAAIAAAADLSPSLIIVLSDLDGPAGPPPRVPVIWAVPRPGPAAPFGEVIALSD